MRYWNRRFLSIPVFVAIIVNILLLRIYERVSSFFWKYNFFKCGKNVSILKGSKIRYPGRISLGNNIIIGRECRIDSEYKNAVLVIDSGSQINIKVNLDFTGNLKIGKNVVISENSTILTHSHGTDPHSPPSRIEKTISDNVWVGSNSILLPQAKNIGANSVIAAGSVVTKDVPENCIVGGNPARVIRLLP